jgi:hypothetical protein
MHPEEARPMSAEFRRDVALFIADAARTRRTVTYGELTLRFGSAAQGYGPYLTAIAEHLDKQGHPLLPVLVVSAHSGLPWVGADIYRKLRLVDEIAIRREQERCFEWDWMAVFSAPKRPSS